MTEKPLLIFNSDNIHRLNRPVLLIGGKAIGLHKLKEAQAKVPEWFTITTEAYENATAELFSKIPSRAAADRLPELTKSISDQVTKVQFPKEIETVVRDAWLKISKSAQLPVAIRSSAVDEDARNLSFAGQMESFLNITDEQGLFSAIRQCWASAFSERAIAYRLENGLDPLKVKVAVVVQSMVDAKVSGVMFTADPVSGDREKIVVSALWGLGEGLVSRGLNADTYYLSRKGIVISRKLSRKTNMIISRPGGGVSEESVQASESDGSTLSAEQLAKLARIGVNLAAHFGFPLDVEFSYDGRDFQVLQARAITSLSSKTHRIIWDNSNIIESYSGVTTPLTFSFISRAYSIVYRQFCEVLGMSKETIKSNDPTFRNMLGLIQGRVFYNLISWYRLVSLLPGFSWNRRFMEQMMGVKESVKLQSEDLNEGKTGNKLIDLIHMATVGIKMIFYQIRLKKLIADFHRRFDEIYSYCREINIDKMKPHEHLKLYQMLERDLLWEWKAPIINDFSAMIFYGLLKHLVVTWGLDETGSLQNDLFCGEEGVLSTEPMFAIINLAKYSQENPKLKELLMAAEPKEALRALRERAEFPEFSKKIDDYLFIYGDRCISELKLESLTLRETPEFLVAMIRNYMNSGAVDPEKQKEKERAIRKDTEEKVRGKLRGKFTRFGLPKSFIFFSILKNARQAVKNRENQRFARTRIYGIARQMFRSIGNNFAAQGLLNDPSDIFYLEYDEIWAFIEGRATLTRLKELAALRRAEFEEYGTLPPPDDRFETTGMVYHGNIFSKPSVEDLEGNKEDVIRGVGCSQGKVTGEVKVVLSPSEDIRLTGEILVASQTDPGWVLLFPSISGLIIERGSMLSHTAIVAREMGIPTVVGAKDATKRLRSGQRVTLDGSAGIVYITETKG